MPLPISSTAKTKKNTLNDSGAWLTLCEFNCSGEDPIRVVCNNENILWSGETWYAMDLGVGSVEQSKGGEMPTLPLTVNDPLLSTNLIPIIIAHSGAVGSDVSFKLVHSDNLSNATPEREDSFKVMKSSFNHAYSLTFDLGAANYINFRCPQDRYLMNHCRYKIFKGAECGYVGEEEDCDRTFLRCKQLENQARFGNTPGVGAGGYFE